MTIDVPDGEFADAAEIGVRVGSAAGIYPAIREELLRENTAFMVLLGDQIYSDGVASLSGDPRQWQP